MGFGLRNQLLINKSRIASKPLTSSDVVAFFSFLSLFFSLLFFPSSRLFVQKPHAVPEGVVRKGDARTDTRIIRGRFMYPGSTIDVFIRMMRLYRCCVHVCIVTRV